MARSLDERSISAKRLPVWLIIKRSVYGAEHIGPATRMSSNHFRVNETIRSALTLGSDITIFTIFSEPQAGTGDVVGVFTFDIYRR